MRIKKFIATTQKESKELIEKELGSEAIILSERKIKTQTGGDALEVVAALDENKIQLQHNNPFAKSTLLSPTNMDIAGETNKKLIAEVRSLKEMMAELFDNVKYKYTGTMPQALARIYKIMRNSDISEEFALDIIGRIAAKGYSNDYQLAFAEARRNILGKIRFSNPIAKVAKRQVITFLGPTGSGKTTSLIKLAIVSKLLLQLKILIISTDIFKIGGAEQLQTLASISGINFQIAYSAPELANIIKEETKYDMIFIDTVGRNPNNKEELDAINELQQVAAPTQTFLVLSSTTSEKAIVNAINKFSPLGISSAIITKVDESAGLGNIISALHKTQLQLSYFTDGQIIPDNIEPASSEKLNDYLFIV